MLRRLNKNSPYLRPENFINGQWVPAATGKTVPVFFPAANPSQANEVLGNIADSNEVDAKSAVDAAVQAFPSWSHELASKRAKLLRAFGDKMRQHQDELAEIISAEAGKVFAEAKGEIAYGASYFDWYAGEAERINGMLLPPFRGGSQPMILKRPVGVVSIITPWNFPNSMITRSAAGALAAGCTVVVKPSEQTPFSATALGVIAKEVGIPDGVFNIVQSGSSATIGTQWMEDARVRKISFTGSVRVGKLLAKQAAQTMKKVTMELGGNAPFMVFDDADVDTAVKQFVNSKFRNSGQTCICPNRILVHESIKETFTDKLVSALDRFKLGNSLADETVTLGPLINPQQRDRVADLVEDAKSKGARVRCGGKCLEDVGPNFYAPTVVDNVSNDMKLLRDEIFGPVIPVISFKTDEEAIKIANDTDVGLASYAFTNSPKRLWKLADELQYGMVGLNDGMISSASIPFGGVKDSGVGRDGGPQGIEAFLDVKYVLQGNL